MHLDIIIRKNPIAFIFKSIYAFQSRILLFIKINSNNNKQQERIGMKYLNRTKNIDEEKTVEDADAKAEEDEAENANEDKKNI